MNKKEFKTFRQKLGKTQREMSQILGVSLSIIHGYEQGWRSVPPHVERQVYFLFAMKKSFNNRKPCWVTRKCPSKVKKNCPAWEFHAGFLCWFINGTICRGEVQNSWAEKIRFCKKCEVFRHTVLGANGKSKSIKRTPSKNPFLLTRS